MKELIVQLAPVYAAIILGGLLFTVLVVSISFVIYLFDKLITWISKKPERRIGKWRNGLKKNVGRGKT